MTFDIKRYAAYNEGLYEEADGELVRVDALVEVLSEIRDLDELQELIAHLRAPAE